MRKLENDVGPFLPERTSAAVSVKRADLLHTATYTGRTHSAQRRYNRSEVASILVSSSAERRFQDELMALLPSLGAFRVLLINGFVASLQKAKTENGAIRVLSPQIAR